MYIRSLCPQLFQWLLIALFCLVQQAHCQTDGCGDNGATTTIEDQAGATALASCTVFSGSIALATGAAGTISLDGVQEILGSLVADSAGQLTALSSDSLRIIDGNFTMNNLTILSTVGFPVLTTVNTISFLALPAVEEFTFTKGLSSVSNVIISNTFLATLDGINLVNADSVDINNNNHLVTVTLPLETAKESISIEANDPYPVISLPDLTSAGTITLRNISSISLPTLSFLSGGLYLIDTTVSDFAVDSLSVVTQELIMLDNTNLSETSFQGLLSAGSISVANNTKLSSLSFEKLSQAVNISIGGNLTSIDMPALTSVNHTFILQSTDPNFNCSIFDSDHTKSVIKGNYTCAGIHQVITSSTTPGRGSGSTPKPSSGLSGGAKAGIAVGCVVVAIAVAIGAYIFMRRRKGKKAEPETVQPVGTDGKAEMDNHEVPRKEMPTGQEAHELEEERVVVEMGANEPWASTYEMPAEPVQPPSRSGHEELS